MQVHHHAILVLALGAGCTGADSDYTLNLVPITADNQAPFEKVDRLVLRLEHPTGEPDVIELDGVDGTQIIEGLPPLDDTVIAVEGYGGSTLLAFGRTHPITIVDAERDIEVFVAEVDQLAWLDRLSAPLHGAAVAHDGLGGFWLFGGDRDGHSSTYPGDPSSEISKLIIAPPTDGLGFSSAATMPEFTVNGSTMSGRIGHSATLLSGAGDDDGLILVAGGNASSRHQLEDVNTSAFLFDPVSLEITDLGSEALRKPRSEHKAVLGSNGLVYLIGGWVDNDYLPDDSWEIYDPGDRSFSAGEGAVPGRGVSLMAASLGSEGVLVCGGLDWGSTYNGDDACVVLAASGQSRDAASLPLGLHQGEMTSLGSGRVLLTGGVSPPEDSATVIGSFYEAESNAYIYEVADDTWSFAGEMAYSRAGHSAEPLPDGRVVVSGGGTAADLLFPGGDLLPCVEVFNPETGFFDVVDEECEPGDATSTMGEAAWGQASVSDPLYGALFVGGTNDGQPISGVSLWVGDPGAP